MSHVLDHRKLRIYKWLTDIELLQLDQIPEPYKTKLTSASK
jgi:hypothetical protein